MTHKVIQEEIRGALEQGNYQQAVRLVHTYAIQRHLLNVEEAGDRWYLARSEIQLAENIAGKDIQLLEMIKEPKEVVYKGSIAEELEKVARCVDAKDYVRLQDHSTQVLHYAQVLGVDITEELDALAGFWYDHNVRGTRLDSSFISDCRLEGINELLEEERAAFRIGPGYEVYCTAWDGQTLQKIPSGLGIYTQRKHQGEEGIEKSIRTAWKEWETHREDD